MICDFVMCDERIGRGQRECDEEERKRWMDRSGRGTRGWIGGFKSCACYGKCHVGIYYVLCYYCMYVCIYVYMYIYTTIGK